MLLLFCLRKVREALTGLLFGWFECSQAWNNEEILKDVKYKILKYAVKMTSNQVLVVR